MLSGHRISQSNHPMLEIQRKNNSSYLLLLTYLFRESYVTLVLDDLKKRFKDLYFEFIAVGELRIDNRSDSAP